MPKAFNPSLQVGLLRRLLVLFWFFLVLLLVCRLHRRGLRALLWCRARFRRRGSALGLRTLTWGRTLWPGRRLVPRGLRPIVRLGCRRTIGLRTVWLRPAIRLRLIGPC